MCICNEYIRLQTYCACAINTITFHDSNFITKKEERKRTCCFFLEVGRRKKLKNPEERKEREKGLSISYGQ